MKAVEAHGAACAVGHPLFAERYRSIHARDVRFDGQFFTAVASTGVYCRPSCPARTPKVQNVTFYLTSASAHEAGFRACKRCMPEAVPGAPEWNLRQDLAGRAMRLIADGTVDREGVDGLSLRLGYSARHVYRVLTSELGAGPLSLARARRAQSARALLVETDLSLADVAFAAGFGSIRQFNDTLQHVFALRPSDIRARYGGAAAKLGAERDEADTRVAPAVRLRVDLPVRQPFDAPGTFGFLAARAVDGVEVADLSVPDRLMYSRTLLLPGGPAAVQVTADRTAGSGWRIRAHLEVGTLADVTPAVARLRRMLDLDADPVAVDAALQSDPAMAALVGETPGIRLPGAVDAHELVVRALVGQQISVAAARAHLGRLTRATGSAYGSAMPGLTHVFPTPLQIAEAINEPEPGDALDPDRPLRLPGQAIRAILAACRLMAGGRLDIDVGSDPDELRARLISLPRIGPWTASYITMRVFGHPDSWLHGDVALLAGARSIGLLSESGSAATGHRALAAHAEQWSPWRSYAVMHLWQGSSRAAAERWRASG